MELVMHQMIAIIRNGQYHAAALAVSQPVKHQVAVTREILQVQVRVRHQCPQVTKSPEVT